MKARFFSKKDREDWESNYAREAGGPSGLCFQYANLALRRFGDDAVVVHATVLHPTRPGHRMHHAWIEHDGRVYDYQNAELLNKSFPVDVYYEATQPEEIQRYTPDGALVAMIRVGRHGPW